MLRRLPLRATARLSLVLNAHTIRGHGAARAHDDGHVLRDSRLSSAALALRVLKVRHTLVLA